WRMGAAAASQQQLLAACTSTWRPAATPGGLVACSNTWRLGGLQQHLVACTSNRSSALEQMSGFSPHDS
ncbi:unnamed protein product, partial [Closterium sp. Naga37s-1]